jgi:hypothetical protein
MFSPIIGDYNAYILHWDQIVEGGNPWNFTEFSSEENVYGPLYALFVIPYTVHYKFPRLLMILSWAIVSFWLLRKTLSSINLRGIWQIILVLLICFSPFMWVRNVFFAQFDILVGLLVLAAVAAQSQGISVLTGIFTACAVALKYYPAVLVPFFSVNNRKLDWHFIISFSLTFLAIFSFTIFQWGNTFLNAITLTSDRQSKILSVFRFLRGPYSPLHSFFGLQNVDQYSIPLLSLTLILLLAFLIYKRIDVISGSALLMITTFTLYKVGHQQFQVTLYLLLIYWIIQRAPLHRSTLVAVGLYILFINLFDVGYYLTLYKGDWRFVRDTVGLLSFCIMVFLFINVFREALLLKDLQTQESDKLD